MTTTPQTNSLCRWINNEKDKELRDLMIEQLVTKRIKNKHGKSERVNLCEKLKKSEDNLRKLKKLNPTPDHDRYKEYLAVVKKLNQFIRLIHKELDDIKRREEITTGGNSMKRKSMKRKSSKRKYSKRN